MRLVVLNFEVENFERVKHVKVIEVGGWVRLNLLKEGSNVGFILERQLQHLFLNGACVELEGELHVGDVVLALRIVDKTRVLSQLEVLSYLDLHILPRPDVVVLDPLENLLESFSGP